MKWNQYSPSGQLLALPRENLIALKMSTPLTTIQTKQKFVVNHSHRSIRKLLKSLTKSSSRSYSSPSSSSSSRALFIDSFAARASSCEDICGIDLGTTNSAIACVIDGRATIVPIITEFLEEREDLQKVSQGIESKISNTMPSVVHYGKDSKISCGKEAEKFLKTDSRNTFSSVKRFIGRKFRKSERERKQVAYECALDERTKRVCMRVPNLGDNVYKMPEEISAVVIERLVRRAEEFRGLRRGTIVKAVITVPAYFDQMQCDATVEAGKIAGLQTVRTLREPIAAALAYGVDLLNPENFVDETIFVFDLGGGTFDVSILEVGGGTVEVLATGGDARLGGDDLDIAVAKWISKECDKKGFVVDFRGALLIARKAREQLSDVKVVKIPLPDGNEVELTRQSLEKACATVLRKMRQPCVECADSAGVNLERLRQLEEEKNKKKNKKPSSSRSAGRPFDRVLLVGGATKTPCVRTFVENTFSRKPELDLVDPDEVVAVGAAVRAGALSGQINNVDTFNPLEAGLIRAFAVAKGLNKEVKSGGEDVNFDDDFDDDDDIEFDEEYLKEDEGEWEDDEIPDDLDDLIVVNNIK